MALTLAVTPEGRLTAMEGAVEDVFPSDVECTVRERLAQGTPSLLLWLAACRTTEGLPLTALFWREFSGVYFTAFCRHSDAAELPAPAPDTWLRWLSEAPPMTGLEHLGPKVVRTLWLQLDAHVREGCAAHAGGVECWLKETLPHWHLVGRVTLHLAENRKDLERPFAFLATYVSGLNAEGQPRHLPLQQAVREYSAEGKRSALLTLLEPLSRATQASAWARQMVDSGEIYRAQAWTSSQALRFLREVPVFEAAGLMVRIPDWWKAASPPRPKVEVQVGENAPTSFNLGSLLSFRIEITLDGEKLSPEEIKALQTAQGLVMIKGRWVEADAEKLKAVLEHWHVAHTMQFQGGVSFLQALRLLAGVSVEIGGQQLITPEVREWSGVTAGPWLEDFLQNMRQPDTLGEITSFPELNASLRPYQAQGVNWLHFLTRLGLGACLADDMGLGKTMQVLALLLHLKRVEPGTGPSLLVAPASLIQNWKAEADKFSPTLRLLVAHSSTETAECLQRLNEDPAASLQQVDLVVTTYGMVSRLEGLKHFNWALIILDEAQAIKNPISGQARAVKELTSRARVALTGTPVENRLGDLWSLFDFINPGLLGTASDFSRFTKSLRSADGAQYAPLRQLVRPYILRRLKTDRSVIQDLPDKVEVTAWCSLTKPQAVLYQQAVESLTRTLAEVEAEHRHGIVLAALMTFKQICNHPAQHSGDSHYDPTHSGKFRRLGELCRVIAERQERVLIFSQFTEIIPALRDFLKRIFGRDGLVLTGKTGVTQRRDLVEEFQMPGGPPFFILSLKAGGTGLTLTAASHVIHFDRWWNPAVENQATDRAYRIGQKRNVMVHKFACRGTLEEKIDRLITDKRKLAEDILADGNELPLTEMSDVELIQFVSLDLQQAVGE